MDGWTGTTGLHEQLRQVFNVSTYQLFAKWQLVNRRNERGHSAPTSHSSLLHRTGHSSLFGVITEGKLLLLHRFSSEEWLGHFSKVYLSPPVFIIVSCCPQWFLWVWLNGDSVFCASHRFISHFSGYTLQICVIYNYSHENCSGGRWDQKRLKRYKSITCSL